MIAGVVSGQISASWKTIISLRSFSTDPTDVTISGVPSGVSIRITVWAYDGEELILNIASTSTTGGNFTDFDVYDEQTEVYVYGNISWSRTSDTNIRFQYFIDYSNAPGWDPSIYLVEAFY